MKLISKGNCSQVLPLTRSLRNYLYLLRTKSELLQGRHGFAIKEKKAKRKWSYSQYVLQNVTKPLSEGIIYYIMVNVKNITPTTKV